MSFTVERWLPVVDWEGCYEVSDLGRVRNVATGTTLKPYCGERYPTLTLKMSGRTMTRRVHVLVAEAFLGPRPDLGVRVDVCHENNDPMDARASNLRYDTHKNNQLQMVRDGRSPARQRTHCKRDHEFTSENTWWHKSRGGNRVRVCRTCHFDRKAAAA